MNFAASFAHLASATMWEHPDCDPKDCFWRELAEGAALPGDFLTAAEQVAEARTRQAEAFLRFKMAGKDVTDTKAMQQAIVETGSALDVALARLEVARSKLNG